ncbi:MAG: hypothetical protein ABI395_11610 [Sphingobium sp.]
MINEARTACRMLGCDRKVRAMEAPHKTPMEAYAINAKDLSISFADLLPRSADDVGTFLFDAAYALGERETDLARAMGISPATLSGWKSRGAIPIVHAQWFADEFPYLVLSSSNPKQHEGFRHAGLPVILHLLKQTNFNPFSIEELKGHGAIDLCYSYLGALSRLGLFVMHRLPTDVLARTDDLERSTALAMETLLRGAAQKLRIVPQ